MLSFVSLFFVLSVGCETEDKYLNPNNVDADGDGLTPFDGDCDDTDPNRTLLDFDADCDGVRTEEDCDDSDSNSTTLVNDGDCDGVLTVDDCDDSDARLLEQSYDSDCDGIATTDDCDDNDPSTISDMDCDGVLTVDDCDDNDPLLLSKVDDGDCNGIPITNDCNESNMVRIFAQTFSMGCTTNETECPDREYPVHSVTLSHDYCMSGTEITQYEYLSLMNSNPSFFSSCGVNCPVESVSWHEAVLYANTRSAQEGLSSCYSCSDGYCSEVMNPYLCTGYRLPTEAEWEAAARCGESTIYAGSSNADNVAWYGEDWDIGSTHPVAGKTPNACGLYDMSGNVWEWVNDWFGDYPSALQTDPIGPTIGSNRVYRGGSWGNDAADARVSYRGISRAPSSRFSFIGFRLVRSVGE